MDVSKIVQEDLARIREHSEKFLGQYGTHNPEHLREIARLATRSAEAWEECRRRGDFSEWPLRDVDDEFASKIYRDLLDPTVPLSDIRAMYAAVGDAK